MADSELHETGSKKDEDSSTDSHGSLPSDYKVLGHNTTGTGTSYGVVGHADATAGYGLYSADDAKISETLEVDYVDTTANDLTIDTGEDSNGRARNIVAGSTANGALAAGAVIAGGGFDDGTTSEPNEAIGRFPTISGGRNNYIGTLTGNWGTISGGRSNQIAPDGNDTHYATIGGGQGNTVRDNTTHGTIGGGQGNTINTNGAHATIGGGLTNEAKGAWNTIAGGEDNVTNSNYGTIGGGWQNEATDTLATVPGGLDNHADGYCSFAAGREAKANHDGTFVFGDSSTTQITTSNADEARFQVPIYAPAFNTTSARAAKTDLEPVDPEAMLSGVESLEVSTWQLDHGEDTRHVGPMAEDFAETFDLENGDDSSIATVDADGVALAAIQGLSEKLADRDDRIEELEAENAELRDRLSALEDHVGLEGTSGQATPADD